MPKYTPTKWTACVGGYFNVVLKSKELHKKKLQLYVIQCIEVFFRKFSGAFLKYKAIVEIDYLRSKV